MNMHDPIVQDLVDILHINQERVREYNKSAYGCDNIQLKMVLNRELDNARDSIITIKRLLRERFGIMDEIETCGQLFSMWSDFKPLFGEYGMNTLLLTLERADVLMLQCYKVVITRPYVDDISKDILEYQYQNNLSIYNTIKAFRETYRNTLNNSMMKYAPRKSA
jgi:hypothetical protein